MHSASSWQVARRTVFILLGSVAVAYALGIFEPAFLFMAP